MKGSSPSYDHELHFLIMSYVCTKLYYIIISFGSELSDISINYEIDLYMYIEMQFVFDDPYFDILSVMYGPKLRFSLLNDV